MESKKIVIVVTLVLLVQVVQGFLVEANRCRQSCSSLGSCSSSKEDSSLVSRRNVISSFTAATTLLLPTMIAQAKESLSPEESFKRVRQELEGGGIVYLEQALKDENYVTLLDFTKTYDQVLRKNFMGQAKKYAIDKNKATELSNAVTFDLIGINRSSRPGQESREEAQKYLQELKDDVRAFLELEQKE